MARWITQLSICDIAVFYRKGTDNTATDFLRRRTYTDKDLRLLPLHPDMHVTGGKSKTRTQDQSTQDNLPYAAAVDHAQLCEVTTAMSAASLYEQLLNRVCIVCVVRTARTSRSDVIFGTAGLATRRNSRFCRFLRSVPLQDRFSFV